MAAFLRNIDSSFYKRSSFYRVLRNDNQVTGAPHSYLIQGGVWESNYDLKKDSSRFLMQSTKQTGILHTRGTISMAGTNRALLLPNFLFALKMNPASIMEDSITQTGWVMHLTVK